MSEWKVLFDTNFWGSAREEDPAFEVGTELERPLPTVEHPINQTVSWSGETWKILSVYTCEKGLVMDYCKQTDPVELAAFVKKFRAAGLEDHFDEEMFERLQLENPSAPDVMIRVSRGDVKLRTQGSSGMHYMPVNWEKSIASETDTQPEAEVGSDHDSGEIENDEVVLDCVAHYQLDESFAYNITRAHFLWDEGHAGDLSGLSVTFYEQDGRFPGEHFRLTGGKQEIALVHPVTGEKYTLHIDHIESDEIAKEHLEWMNSIRGDDETEMLYPSHFETVYYSVEPEDGADQFCLNACVKGDSPIEKGCGAAAASSVSVIGGACGPTSIFVGGKVKSELHLKSICSPLFFEPTPVREWYVKYFVKRREELCVELICER